MKLICLAPHVYQERRFNAGEVYDLDDELATGFLRDWGPVNSDASRRFMPPRFDIPPVAVEPEEITTTSAPVEVMPSTAEVPVATTEKPARKPRAKKEATK